MTVNLTLPGANAVADKTSSRLWTAAVVVLIPELPPLLISGLPQMFRALDTPDSLANGCSLCSTWENHASRKILWFLFGGTMIPVSRTTLKGKKSINITLIDIVIITLPGWPVRWSVLPVSGEEPGLPGLVLVHVAHGVEHGAEKTGGGDPAEPPGCAVGFAEPVAEIAPSHRCIEE